MRELDEKEMESVCGGFLGSLSDWAPRSIVDPSARFGTRFGRALPETMEFGFETGVVAQGFGLLSNAALTNVRTISIQDANVPVAVMPTRDSIIRPRQPDMRAYWMRESFELP